LAKHAHLLTQAAVEKLKPSAVRREIPDGGGLFLLIQPSGAKSWAVRYRRDGRPRKLTLGPVDLKTARKLAHNALESVAHGGDPGAAKIRARLTAGDSQTNFESVAADFLNRYINKKKRRPRPRTLEELARHLGMLRVGENWEPKKGGLADRWRGRKVSEIYKGDIIAKLDEQVARGIGANANRLRATLYLFFSWCFRRELVALNPCFGVDPPVAEESRDRVLSDAELALFWRAADGEALFGPLWKVLALTGQRRDEARGMTWNELDFESALWSIPAGRVKNDREHIVPLSPLALKILQAQPHIGGKHGPVFTATGTTMLGGLSRAKARLDARMLAMAKKRDAQAKLVPWRIHDLRRTCASTLQMLGVSLPVIEKILNHTGGSFGGVAGVYLRDQLLDERRAALDSWARHVEALVTNSPAKILTLRRKTSK